MRMNEEEGVEEEREKNEEQTLAIASLEAEGKIVTVVMNPTLFTC